MEPLEVIAEEEGYRLLRCGDDWAVVEVRAGRVYSLHGRERRDEADGAEGMRAVVGDDGWSDRETAERRFAQMIGTERRYAERIW